MHDRVDLLNVLCSRYPHPRYLEIGCAGDDCFANIDADIKIGVDPMRGGTHRMTSDEFFATDPGKFDVVFIDGLHFADQAMRDFTNAEKHLSPSGAVVLHDCLPPNFESTDPEVMRSALERGQAVDSIGVWCGEVWRALVGLLARDDLDIVLWPEDFGCAIVLHRPTPPIRVACKTYAGWMRRWKASVPTVSSRQEMEAWL